MNYKVQSIDKAQTHEWLTYKHYAKRVPSIEIAVGLFAERLVGVLTFGCPPRVMNNGEAIFKSYRVKTYELNRLCIDEGLEPNALSFFVSRALRLIEPPACVVSYADHTRCHHGYIYQATNWTYTGLNQVHEREWYLNGKEVHQRTLSSIGLTSAEKKLEAGLTVGEYTSKHRYLYFIGNSKQRKTMLTDLIYTIMPYPKGDNVRYDASYKPLIQQQLFT